MKMVKEFRDNARDCRAIAKRMPSAEDRERLEAMAKAWDRLARAREHELSAGAEADDL